MTMRHPLSETTDAVVDLYKLGMRLGLETLESLNANWMSMTNRMLSPSTLDCLKPEMTIRRSSGGCRIPPPCWAPQPIGTVVSHGCQGGTATVRLRITNCSVKRRNITVDAVGKVSGVTVTPSNLVLDPMEHDYVAASVMIPADSATGTSYELILWVHGCQDHYLRWTVRVASRGVSCCHEIEVDDCPDLVHHWYDHFYCERPCFH